MFELDFLPVGDGNADAICMQYSVQGGMFVHVVDGGYAETGEKIVEHIRQHYGRDFFINHMVLSHADNDHAAGLVEVMKRIAVKNLWMNRPWLFAGQTIKHFHGAYTLKGLTDKMREMHSYLVQLEELAAAQGTQIHEVFQGSQIGKWTVLAPSRERYIRLIPDLDKTPTRHSAADTLGGILSKALSSARDKLYETWDIETLSGAPDPTSASNESSVVQFAELDGQRLLLTADAGPEGLNEAADYAASLGRLQIPHMVQVPHHGSRRNVVPKVLDRWLGGKMAKSMSCGVAICSVGENKHDFPRGQVSNAFLRRGYPVYVTRGKPLLHHSGGSRGWPAAQPLPFCTEVEDKAAA